MKVSGTQIRRWVSLLGLAASAVSTADVPASLPLPVHLWWARASMAAGVLDRAREFEVTGLILENDLGNVG